MTLTNLPVRRTPAALVLQRPAPAAEAPARSDTPLRVAIVGTWFGAVTVMGAIAGRAPVMWVGAGLTLLALIGLGVALVRQSRSVT